MKNITLLKKTNRKNTHGEKNTYQGLQGIQYSPKFQIHAVNFK